MTRRSPEFRDPTAQEALWEIGISSNHNDILPIAELPIDPYQATTEDLKGENFSYQPPELVSLATVKRSLYNRTVRLRQQGDPCALAEAAILQAKLTRLKHRGI